MPRPIWSGAISFGLVTIPIKVVNATENHSISFRQIHLEDGGSLGVQAAAIGGGVALLQLSGCLVERIHRDRCGGIAGSGEGAAGARGRR
jgi:hypothetical protein